MSRAKPENCSPEWRTCLDLARLISVVVTGLSMSVTPALAGSELTVDHREALELGCRRQSAGNTLAYHSCIQNALNELERGRKLATVDALAPTVREQVRLACIGKKEFGLFDYDDCIRPLLPQPEAARIAADTPAPNAPGWDPSGKPRHDTGDPLEPAKLFELTSSSVYFVNSRGKGSISSIGSAVAVSDTLMLTNCHVVAQAQEVLISETGAAPWLASLRYADRKTDRCVLESARPLMPAAGVRAYADLKVGERVYTIGNPSGFSRTLTEGLVSGLRTRDGLRLVQTSAAISPGSSGGGLFDNHGRLVGITTFTVGEESKLGFAIAAEEFTRLPPLAR